MLIWIDGPNELIRLHRTRRSWQTDQTKQGKHELNMHIFILVKDRVLDHQYVLLGE